MASKISLAELFWVALHNPCRYGHATNEVRLSKNTQNWPKPYWPRIDNSTYHKCSQHQKYVNRVRTWCVSWSLNHTFLMSQTSQIWIESLICDVIYLVCFSYHALMSAALVLGEVTLTRIFQRPLLMHQQPFLWLMVAHNDHLLGWWSLTTTIYLWSMADHGKQRPHWIFKTHTLTF